jgi:hypothetical protein
MKTFKCRARKCKEDGPHYWSLRNADGFLATGHFCARHFIAIIREHINWGKTFCRVEPKK